MLASWASIWRILAGVNSSHQITAFKTIVLVANLVLSILEVFALRSMTSSSRKRRTRRRMEDARRFSRRSRVEIGV